MSSHIVFQPIISSKESSSLREYILSCENQVEWNRDPSGGKLSLHSNKKDGFDVIFRSRVIQKIADYILSPEFLDQVFYLMKAFNVFEVIKNNNIVYNSLSYENVTSIFPYVRPMNSQRYGKYAAWMTRLSSPGDPRGKLDVNTLFLMLHSYCLLGRLPILPEMHFSVMRKGSRITPHTDDRNKLASFMIYLPSSSQQESSSLGTTFWYPKELTWISQPDNVNIDHWESLPFFTSDSRRVRTYFGDASMVGFFRSDISWHSVELPESLDEPRVSLNINFRLPINVDK